MVKQRNIALCIIFSILTCGLYFLYWQVVLVDDLNYISNEKDTSGIGVVLLSIITCNIYWLYFVYKMGRKINAAWERKGRTIDSNNSLIYLLLSLFGLNIVTMCLMQAEANRFTAE